MKRFYKTVAVEAAEDGHRILLDGRPVQTPAQQPLLLPNGRLAGALAGEWEAQGADIVPQSMPLTQLCCTYLDMPAPARAALAEETAAYAAHDLLCFRAEAPENLVARQAAAWQPLLDWCALRYDAPLNVTAGVMSIPQPDTSLAALAAAVSAHRDLSLIALAHSVRISGSLVIGLALSERQIDAEAAFEAAELDETFQIEIWGVDKEAAARRANRLADLKAAERLLHSLQAEH